MFQLVEVWISELAGDYGRSVLPSGCAVAFACVVRSAPSIAQAQSAMLRCFLLLVVSTTVLAACDSSDAGPQPDRITSTLVEYTSQQTDSLVAGRASGFAAPIAMDGAWKVTGLQPSTGVSLSWKGNRPDTEFPFAFYVEQCEGGPISAQELLSDNRYEPYLREEMVPTAASEAAGEGPCSAYVFSIAGFGDSPTGVLTIYPNGKPLVINMADHVIQGSPAIAADGSDFQFSQDPTFGEVWSRLEASGAATDALPLEVYRMNGETSSWGSRAGKQHNIGYASSSEPMDRLRYFVFLLDL